MTHPDKLTVEDVERLRQNLIDYEMALTFAPTPTPKEWIDILNERINRDRQVLEQHKHSDIESDLHKVLEEIGNKVEIAAAFPGHKKLDNAELLRLIYSVIEPDTDKIATVLRRAMEEIQSKHSGAAPDDSYPPEFVDALKAHVAKEYNQNDTDYINKKLGLQPKTSGGSEEKK